MWSMSTADPRNPSRARLALLSALLLSVLMVPLLRTPAGAANPNPKAIVDAAKAQGIVGEQADGYLGLVHGTASPAITAAVTQINAGRAAVYRSTATKTGVSVAAAGQATAQQLFARMPAGEYYKPLGGGWKKKP